MNEETGTVNVDIGVGGWIVIFVIIAAIMWPKIEIKKATKSSIYVVCSKTNVIVRSSHNEDMDYNFDEWPIIFERTIPVGDATSWGSFVIP